MNLLRLLKYMYAFSIFFLGTFAYAATGTIDPVFYSAKVCHDVTCTLPTPGVLNFKPTGVAPVVVDDVSGITGTIWGNELGWIKLNPTGQGLSLNPTTGAVTGKAWSQVSGWVNFNPTGQGVFIDTNTGEFSGWAWTGGPYGGWIKFDCGAVDTCVKTTWRPEESSNPSSGGCAPGSSCNQVDRCSNIVGIQITIPEGYVSAGDVCVIPTIDVCPNLIGEQNTVPLGFSISSIGACVSNQIDYCPNITGQQVTVPIGYIVSDNGDCLSDSSPVINEATDACINIPGAQSVIPPGYSHSNSQCFKLPEDICPNIVGSQTSIPEAMMINAAGSCVPVTYDACDNIPYIQEDVPEGYTQSQGICLLETTENKKLTNEEVVAFPFIPENIQIPSDLPLLKTGVSYLDTHVNDAIARTSVFKVDLITTGISIAGLIGILRLLMLLFGRRRWGIVYDAQTKKPLGGFVVSLYNDRHELVKKTTTNKKGYYDFSVPKGRYRAMIETTATHSFPALSLDFAEVDLHQGKPYMKKLYYGGYINVHTEGRSTLNIPLDPLVLK